MQLVSCKGSFETARWPAQPPPHHCPAAWACGRPSTCSTGPRCATSCSVRPGCSSHKAAKTQQKKQQQRQKKQKGSALSLPGTRSAVQLCCSSTLCLCGGPRQGRVCCLTGHSCPCGLSSSRACPRSICRPPAQQLPLTCLPTFICRLHLFCGHGHRLPRGIHRHLQQPVRKGSWEGLVCTWPPAFGPSGRDWQLGVAGAAASAQHTPIALPTFALLLLTCIPFPCPPPQAQQAAGDERAHCGAALPPLGAHACFVLSNSLIQPRRAQIYAALHMLTQ